MIVEVESKDIEVARKVQGYCRLPYPKHPNGCPNYGRERNLRGIRQDLRPRVLRECCPTELMAHDIFDFSKPLFMIYTIFPVGKDAQERSEKSTKLNTWREFYNFRYWQNRARNPLYRESEKFLDEHEGTVVDLCPEAHGVELDITMKNLGITLPWGEWPPKHSIDNIRYQIAIGGNPNRTN